ncbi:MAG: AtpZ/AtpI family protein [Campylobacteraceae bacterium]
MSEEKKEPKAKKLLEGAEQLSLGISIVVAVIIGVLIGIGLKKLTGEPWTFWIGVVWGVGAAILNVYIAYKKQMKSFKKLEDDPKYKNYKPSKDDDDEDDKY